MMAGHALQRGIARLLVVGPGWPRRRAPRIGRRLHRLDAFGVHGAVALDAPAHGQFRARHRHARQIHQIVDDVLPGARVYLLHSLDAAVARLAYEPRLDVIHVRKLRELGNTEHADPRNRLLPLPVAVELLHLLVALRGHDLVAAHALLHRRDARIGASPRVGVAVLAGDLVRARVDYVAEEDGLHRSLALRGDGQDLGGI